MFEGVYREFVLKNWERTPGWNKKRKECIKKYKVCAACGTNKNLQVHHILPFFKYPNLELDIGNLICLCGKCHFIFGHLWNWKTYNPNVAQMCRFMRYNKNTRLSIYEWNNER